MRRSRLFCQTLRENPAESEVAGHQLLVRAGYVQPLAAGIITLLPLGQLVASRIESIIRQEMDAIEGQELSMPVVHPGELWQESRRWYDVGPELVRFRDRADRDMVLAMTHEEVVADLLRKQVRSYRQLPVMLYHFQTKFRDEPRSRGGLLRVREFVMKDAYSCHTSFADLDRYYPSMYQAYFNVFRRAGLEVIAVAADVGMMGGTEAHEFMYLTDIGEDQIALCGACGYHANRQVATFHKELSEPEDELTLEEVSTPGTKTIAALTRLLNIPERRTAKAAFFSDGDQLIFAVVRGDMDVNETKLANVLGSKDLRAARAEDLDRGGIVAGYASPIGVEGVTVVVDDVIQLSPNLVAGANRQGHHFLNTNFPRDYRADIVADIAAAYDGAICPNCTAPLRLVRGVEVGNLFKLGTRYTEALDASFLDEQGESRHVVMGSYGIGVGRLLACIAEECRDEQGLNWPVSVAPYQVYLVGLDLSDDGIRDAAEIVYRDLQAAGFDVLFDDREERAGVKFNDADLLGMPLRVTVSRRSVGNESAEVKRRSVRESRHVPLTSVVEWVATEVEDLKTGIDSRVRQEAFPT